MAGLRNDRAVLDPRQLDLYLTPPGGGIGLLDFEALPLLVEEAYRYICERLAELDAGAWPPWPAVPRRGLSPQR